MIRLEDLEDDEVRDAIKSNFCEKLDNNPSDFEQYFKSVYKDYNVRASDIFYELFNDYANKYPNILFNICKFILIDKNDYYGIVQVPVIFYTNHKEKYLNLLKIAINNSSNVFSAMYILRMLAKSTNDSCFLVMADLLNDKSKEYIDAQKIFSRGDISNLQDININWNKYCDIYYRYSICEGTDIKEIKNALCKKLYNVSFENMLDRYYQYIFSNHTMQLDNQFIYFKKIMMSISKEEIIKIYYETINIKNELKVLYDNTAKKIDTDSKKSLSDISKYKVPEELKLKTINNISVYDISESEFNLIIHNISAGLGHKEIKEKINNDLSVWSGLSTEGSITISTSEISNKFLGHLTRSNQEVYFAFSNIPEDEIFFSGTYDIGFNVFAKDYSKLNPSDGVRQHFLAKQLMTNCFYDYNEIVINRYYDKSKIEKRIPNYIVCFDEVNELSLRYAEYFKIPILYIDTKRCAYKNAAKIKYNLEKTNSGYDLLNNINEFFSFICGLKYSNVVFDVVSLNNWENLIINSIKSVIVNTNGLGNIKEMIVIIDYIERNAFGFLNGVKSKWNNSSKNYDKIISNFSNLSQQISDIRNVLYNKALATSVSVVNSETTEKNRIQR